MSKSTKAERKLTLRQVFARNLRLVRIRAGMSQERLADEAQLDRAFVGTLERGQRNVSIDNIERLAAAVNASVLDLLDPTLPEREGLDESVRRVTRTARPYPVPRQTKSGSAG
jgi:transcriptional regulator with XRE-family HTH domain